MGVSAAPVTDNFPPQSESSLGAPVGVSCSRKGMCGSDLKQDAVCVHGNEPTRRPVQHDSLLWRNKIQNRFLVGSIHCWFWSFFFLLDVLTIRKTHRIKTEGEIANTFILVLESCEDLN